jgi:hypothetical protein
VKGPSIVSIIVHDASADPIAAGAVLLLEGMAEAGLIDPLWTVDIGNGPDRDWTVCHCDPQGKTSWDGLLNGIASGGVAEIAQVLAVGTAAMDQDAAVDVLAADTAETVAALKAMQPHDARVVDARIVAPMSLQETTTVVGLFSSYADVNLLLLPEDRASDDHFGAPIAWDRPEDFKAHVAAELASHGGLWTGVDGTPLAAGAAGVIGVGDTKVTMARSYARLLIGPPVPLEAALADIDQLPVPSGREPSVDPSRAVCVSAARLIERTGGLSFKPPEPYRPPVEALSTGSAVRRLVSEVGVYLRSVPHQLRAGAFADLDEVAAEAVGRAVGSDAIIGVTRSDYGPVEAGHGVERVVRSVDYELSRLRAVRDASPLGPEVWPHVVASVLAVADGSSTSSRTAQAANHGRGAVVALLDHLSPEVGDDPSGVATELQRYEVSTRHRLLLDSDVEDDSDDQEPDPDEDAEETDDDGVDEASDESDEGSSAAAPQDPDDEPTGVASPITAEPPSEDEPPMLLGEVVARLGQQANIASRVLDTHVAELHAAKEKFADRSSGLGALAWIMGGLVALLVTVVAVQLGLPQMIGVDEWSGRTTTLAGVALAAVALIAAGAAAAAVGAFDPTNDDRMKLTAKLVVITAAGVLAFGASRDTRVGEGSLLGASRVSEIAFFITVIALLVTMARSESRLRTPAGDAAARLTGSVTLAYVALSFMGGLVRPSGWYESLDSSARRWLWLGSLALIVVAMLVVLGVIATRRVKERLRLRDEAARLRWRADAAIKVGQQMSALRAAEQQMLGSTTALARIFRRPFGNVAKIPDERPDDPGRYCPANKVHIQRFDLDQRAREMLVARIRHQLADVGWLVKQYEAAVEAFRPELAMLYGIDPDEESRVRPELDPTSEVFFGSTGSVPRGMRWDFVRLLYAGTLDPALQAPLGELATDELLSGYIDRPGGRIDGSPSSIAEFAAPLATGVAPDLPVNLFSRLDLPVAGDAATRLNTTLWWPRNAVDLPRSQGLGEVEVVHVHNAGSRGLIIPFIRTDWSVPLPLKSLPISGKDSRTTPVGPTEMPTPPIM